MKRALLICVLAVILCLSACTVTVTPSYSEHSYPEESVLPSSEDSVVYSFEESSEENAELCAKVYKLIRLDRQIIDIFANGALKSELAGDVPALGEYGVLREDSEFFRYESVVSLLDKVYADTSTVKERYLQSCPQYGPLALREGEGGCTEASFIYSAGFCPNVDNANISFLEETESGYAFNYDDGERRYTVHAVETSEGLRLTDSLYYIEQEWKKSLPWVQNTVTERNGSCKTLSGKCMIINVFANDSNSYWTDAAKADARAMLNEGLEFLKDAADGYEVSELSFTTVEVDFRVGEDAADYTAGGNYGKSAFIGTEYDGIKQFTDSVCEGKSYDNVCVLFHFNKHGRSYFVPCERDFTNESEWFYEFGVMFYSTPEQGDYFSCPAVYAHELLHAFGAKDLYEGTVSELGDKLAGTYFASDLMRYEPTNIRECYIGPLTAKLIGWDKWLTPQLKAVLDECL